MHGRQQRSPLRCSRPAQTTWAACWLRGAGFLELKLPSHLLVSRPQVPFSLVFTKTDKRKKRCATAAENIAAFQGQLLASYQVSALEIMPASLTVSRLLPAQNSQLCTADARCSVCENQLPMSRREGQGSLLPAQMRAMFAGSQ